MKKKWIQRMSGVSLVAVAVGLIPFLNDKGELERPVTVTIPFERGLTLADEARSRLALALKASAVRSGANVVISGHTGSRGDEEANIALSSQRAETIAQLMTDQGVAEERIETVGLGGAESPPREEGESDRAYQRRLARVDVLIAP